MHPLIVLSRRLALGLLLVAATGGCGTVDDATAEPRLPGSARSLDELARRSWTALVAADTAALEALRLTEREHTDLVWPELPASRPEVGMAPEFAWQNLEMRHHWDRQRLLGAWHASDLVYRSVRCDAEAQEYPSFRVLSGCSIELRDPRGGQRHVRIFDDVLEMQGEYKLFRLQAGE